MFGLENFPKINPFGGAGVSIDTFFAVGVSVRGIGGEDMHLANHRQSVVLSTFHPSTSYPDYIIMQ